MDDFNLAMKWAKQLGRGLWMGWDQPQLPWKFISIAESDRVLGRTFSNLVLDLRGSFTANDLGKVIPTVKGGGIIVLITPKFEEWVRAKLSYHRKLAIPPYTVEDCRTIFLPRLIRKFYEHEGIWIYRNGRWEKESREEEIEVGRREKLKFPRDSIIPHEIYSIAKTQDQIEVLKLLENLDGIRLSKSLLCQFLVITLPIRIHLER